MLMPLAMLRCLFRHYGDFSPFRFDDATLPLRRFSLLSYVSMVSPLMLPFTVFHIFLYLFAAMLLFHADDAVIRYLRCHDLRQPLRYAAAAYFLRCADTPLSFSLPPRHLISFHFFRFHFFMPYFAIDTLFRCQPLSCHFDDDAFRHFRHADTMLMLLICFDAAMPLAATPDAD